MLLLRFFLVLLLVSAPSFAQEDVQPTFLDQIPEDILSDGHQFLTLTLENDLFGSGDDKNYTHGTRLTYFEVGGMETDGLPSWVYKLVPTYQINKTTSVFYSIGQNLFAPADIERRQPDPKDRPYAGFLYGSAGYVTVVDDYIDSAEVTLGIVGPAAFGEQTQDFVHDVVDTRDPSGWDHQLENEPGFILSFQRDWPDSYSMSSDDLRFSLSPHAGFSLGNVYTYAATGVTLQVTPEAYRWQDQPLRVRPAMPGSGFFSTPPGDVAWSTFLGLEGRAVARNIFLDGNTFTDSPSVEKKNFVLDVNAGVTASYGNKRISYTLNWRSPEFDGQDDRSLFGAVSLGYRF